MIDDKRKEYDAKYYQKIKSKRQALYEASKVPPPTITFTEEELSKYIILFQNFGNIVSNTNIRCAEPIDMIDSYLRLEISFTGIEKIKFYTTEKEILMHGMDASIKQRQMFVNLLKNLKDKFGGNILLTSYEFRWSSQGEPVLQLANAILPRLTGFQKTLCQFYINFMKDAPVNDEQLLYQIWLWRIKNKTCVYEPLEPISLTLLNPPEYTPSEDTSINSRQKLLISCKKECAMLGIISDPHLNKSVSLLIHKPDLLKLTQACNRLAPGQHIQILEQALYNERTPGDNIILSQIRQKIIQFKRN